MNWGFQLQLGPTRNNLWLQCYYDRDREPMQS
uniref:Uncharacterized protein n=1 Tax=Anguilla anguilla TaxID=7936 RepID=A0A0E9VRQ9_ANGAN